MNKKSTAKPSRTPVRGVDSLSLDPSERNQWNASASHSCRRSAVSVSHASASWRSAARVTATESTKTQPSCHCSDVRWMGGVLLSRRAAVVDLSAPLGWTGSPALYGVFGRAISYLVASESPASMHAGSHDAANFFAYVWVDDPIMVRLDFDDRCRIAKATLRLAMLAVLGPTAINEDKFTSWFSTIRALGLDSNTVTRTVAIPSDKIAKALRHLHDAQTAACLPVVVLMQLLGSLHHVATCLRSARPFYQRLHTTCARYPRHASVPMSQWIRDGLAWFDAILQLDAFHAVPTRLFGSLPDPDIHVYCDASDSGLCVLDPALKCYIVFEFDATERRLVADRSSGFDINVREQFAIAVACWCLGEQWRARASISWLHVRFWTDNVTAMARTNKLAASNLLVQELTWAIGFAEAAFQLCVSAVHLPGAANRVADADSRLSNRLHRVVFANATHDWSQVHVPSHLRQIDSTFSMYFKPHHWHHHLDSSTHGRGRSGALSASSSDHRPACQPTHTSVVKRVHKSVNGGTRRAEVTDVLGDERLPWVVV